MQKRYPDVVCHYCGQGFQLDDATCVRVVVVHHPVVGLLNGLTYLENEQEQLLCVIDPAVEFSHEKVAEAKECIDFWVAMVEDQTPYG